MNRKQGKNTLSKTMAYLISSAMLVSNVSPAYATSHITIDNFGSGSLHYISGYANTDYLYARDDGSASPSDYTRRFSDWVGGPLDDTLTMKGGALNTYGLTQNGALYADSGNITVNSGRLNLASGSYISDAANLSLLSGSILRLTGGNVTINAGDSINSNAVITATSGNLSFTGGTHYISSGSSISSNLSITDGTVEVANADKLQTNFSNAGNLTLDGGTQARSISGTGNVAIAGNVTNTGAINQTALSNTSTFTNDGTVNANLANAGVLKGTGNIVTKTGASSNTNALSQTNLTNNGTFDNNGQITLAGSLTNNDAAIFNTNAGLLASANGVSNAGILNFTGGTNTNVVTGDGTLNITGDLENQESISQKDITVASGKVVTTNASNMTASDAITNDGIINYTAGTTANIIDGDGRIDITGYVTNTGDIDQTTVSNSGVFTNNGTVNAKLVNTNAIEGTGSITTKTGVSSNSGTIEQASLTNNGTFDNNGHITLTGALTNNSTFNTNADLVSAVGGIDNQSALNITGGTNKNVITGGGTTSFTNDVTNSAAITQALVNNSGNLTNNALITAGVVNSGTLTTHGTNISGSVANTGSYVITDGNNANDIIGAGGTTSILGDTTNTGTIMQEALKIANSGSLTTDAESVVASVTNDGRLTWNAGTANENVISGSGQLDITNGNIVNSASIKQNKIKIAGGSLTSDADLLASTNGITNNVADGLTLTGGTNSNVIDGAGSMAIAGDVTNQAAIGQDSITVSNGTLTTDAGLLTIANGITNNDGLSFTGGQNDNAVSGTGTTFIDGTVTNAADISTDIQVNATGNLSTLTDIASTVENRNIVQLVDADITNTGRIKGSGTINILGDTTNGGKIEGTELNIAAGSSLLTSSDDVTALVTNDGALTWDDGSSNNNVIKGSGSLDIAGGDIVNNAAITQGSISITSGSLTSNADLLASAAGITNDVANGLTLNGGTNTNAISGTGALTTQGEVTNQAAIDQTTLINDGTLLNAGTIKANVTNNGNLASDADDIEGNITNEGTYAITDGDNTNNITGEGDLQILGKTANNATIHQDTITINTGATLVAANMGDITTSTKIDNAGVFEMQGGTNGNVIEGDFGALKVTGAVTNTSGVSITQDNLDIATLGSLTADADDLKTVNGITNAGALTLGNGTTANAISGSGTLTIASGADVTNTGNIDQKSLTNNGTFTSKADLLAFANGIANSSTLNLTGGTNNNVITDNTGTTNFTGDVINNGAITQATVTNDTGVLTNNAAINAAFANNGGTVNNEAVIKGAITNTGTINSTADNLDGTVTNDGTLNVAGGVVKGDITTTVTDSTMNITDNLINDYSIEQATVYNTAHFTNRGAITADLDNEGMIDNTDAIEGNITNHNNGTIDSSADYLQGPIANDGTLNILGGTMQNVVTGSGEMNILAELTNAQTITQGTVTNDAVLTNGAAITATTITNNGTIKGKAADLIASDGIVNDGTLEFKEASTGASDISGTGKVNVIADTTLTGSNSYTGGTLIGGASLTVAGQNNLSTSDVLFADNSLLHVTAADTLSNNMSGKETTNHVRVQNDAALTLNGTIGSAADFRKSGAGTMTLAMASNNYTGSTYVDEGTLVGNTQNIKNTVKGAADTTVEFTDTTDAALNEIDTLGNFVQSGSAVLNVSDNAFSAKQADINAGTFAANRDVTVTTALNVNDGATLRGNGNIFGTVNVNNGGTIAPGNSIDTLTITGDVNFASGSTTAIEINETPASDKLVITGNANIASGANLAVSNENGRYFEWKSFEIVDAGNVAGEFTYDGTITDYDASRINVEVDYSDPTKVVLLAKRKATTHTETAGLSRNQSEVARAIDAVSTGYEGDITNALLQYEQLGGLNPQGVTPINAASTLQSALDDTDGVLYANSALTPLFNAKTAHVYDRIAKRNPSAGKCSTCHDNVWAEYYSQYDKVYSDANSPRFTNNMTGVLVGYDRSSDEALLGVYGGAGKSDLRQQNDTMDIDDVSLGIYGGYRPGNWVFKGTLFGGYQTYHGKRSINFMARNAEGKYHGLNMALDLEGGYDIAVYDWLNLKPFAGILGNYTHLKSFTETGAGALNLHVESKNQFNTQARLGVQLEGKIGKRFNWYGSAAVKQFIGGDYAKLHMSLDLPGTRMEIISAELGRTYFSGQVGVSYALTNHWTVFGNLDTGVNNKSTNCYGNVGLAYTW